jgi:predicted dehydrogenase
MAKLRLGIVGVGKHGARYARHAAADVPGIELKAVCRRDEATGRALAAELRCEYEADALALVRRPDIDAVVFATVPSLLERLVPAALESRKRLLIEKPVAPDVATGARLLAAIESSGAYCMAGHTLRFNTMVRRMRELVPMLGRIDALVFSQRFPPQLALDWLDDPARSGGGNVLHTGVHCFDLIRYLTGLEPATVWCTTERIHTRRTEDNFVARIGFAEGGVLAVVSCSRTVGGRNGWVEVAGEHGQLCGDHVLNTLVRLGPGGAEPIPLAPASQTVLEALRQFVADAERDAAPAVCYRDGLAAVATAAACYASAASGRIERVVSPTAA